MKMARVDFKNIKLTRFSILGIEINTFSQEDFENDLKLLINDPTVEYDRFREIEFFGAGILKIPKWFEDYCNNSLNIRIIIHYGYPYEVQDFNIIDKRTSEIFYVREVLDSGCYEYNSSKLSKKRRLEIIAHLGIDKLFHLLDDCYKYSRRAYNALHETEFTLYRLLGVQFWKTRILKCTPNVWKMAIDYNYTSYSEIKNRRVVAQGWSSTGDLSDRFGFPCQFVKSDPRISCLDRGGIRNITNLLCNIKVGDFVIACKGLSIEGICEIGSNINYHYDPAFDYANCLFPVDWVDWTSFQATTGQISLNIPRGELIRISKNIQSITNAWSQYNQGRFIASKRATFECCGSQGQPILSKNSLTQATNHPQCLRNSTLKTTRLQQHFGFPEIEVRVTRIPRDILATLTFDELRLDQALSYIKANYMEFNHNHIEGLDKINDLRPRPDDHWISSDNLKRIQNIIDIIFREEVNCPLITVDFDGVFLCEPRHIEQYEFPPGCYIANYLEDDRLIEVENHELTHAYIYAHKKLNFDCLYIDEGLAEYGGKISTHSVINKSEVSRYRYYNFLDYVISLNPGEIHNLANNWILGTQPASYWCSITAPYRPQ